MAKQGNEAQEQCVSHRKKQASFDEPIEMMGK